MSTVQRRVTIEPLSRATWNRVESRLFESLDRGEHLVEPAAADRGHERWSPRARWLATGLLATGLAVAAVLLLFLRPSSPENVLRVAGARVAFPAATGAQALPAPSRIETNTAAVQSAIGDSVLEIAAHSALRVSGDDTRGWLIELEAGQVSCHVAPRRGRPPFVVRAGETRVTVVGTRFSVERRFEGARVTVQEGIVRVQSGTEDIQLHPGQTWPERAAPSAPPVPEPAAPAKAKAKLQPMGQGRARAAQRRFERAALLEATDPKQALRIYRQLDRSGPWRSNALYARARLELALGQPQAQQDLRSYLKRYPDGPNAEDVRGLLNDSASSGAAHGHSN